MVTQGYEVLPIDPRVTAWARAAYQAAIALDTSTRRHRGTWFVGVDALPNAPDGAIGGVSMPFAHMAPDWHAAQVSIVYDGYPRHDAGESETAHRFRMNRDAAHMDGLLPEGPDKRRHLREPHAFIIGMALNEATASPLVVWEGSHLVMGAAFAHIFGGVDPADFGDVDVTDAYQNARREVFATCRRVEVPTAVGEAVVLHRHLIHGVAPWAGKAPAEGRIIAYFRPITGYADWL
ncbi:MAG: hypothetical protein ACI9TA_001827 [Reinekea sp.]